MGIKLYKACDMSTLTIINNVKMYCCIIYSSEKDRLSVAKINWKVKNIKKNKSLTGTTLLFLLYFLCLIGNYIFPFILKSLCVFIDLQGS